MFKPKVFVSRRIQQEILDLTTSEAEVNVWPKDTPIPPERLRDACREVDGLFLQTSDMLDAAFFQVATRLRVVAVMGTGVDNVDVAEATRHGIAVGNTPGVTAKSTADMAMGLLMAAARRIVEADKWLRSGNWKCDLAPMGFLGPEVHGSTLGIIGMGKIGLEVAKRARGFDMKVIYFSRTRKSQEEEPSGISWVPSLSHLFDMADFVTLHVPLTNETRHMIGQKELAQMKSTAILVNTSRGAVVDQKALYEALTSNTIAGAALDVMEAEPILMDDPITTLDNVVVIPHLGTATYGTRLTMAMIAAQNLLAGLKRQTLPHCVNPEVYSAW